MAKLLCSQCNEAIPHGVHPYTMRIELFPRVEESVEFSEAELQIDFEQEWKNIIAKLEAMDEKEVLLEKDRVFSRFSFVLCVACRDLLAKQFRRTLDDFSSS